MYPQTDDSQLGDGFIGFGVIHGLVAVDRQLDSAPPAANYVLGPVMLAKNVGSLALGYHRRFVSLLQDE